MYLGRIVAVGMTPQGRPVAMYRVSSRSFPNREAVKKGETAAVMPRAGFEDDLKKSPYITYNCVRVAGEYGVASNGSHTDPIAEKIIHGLPPRDALALTLLALDYEKDAYDTPRIAAVVRRNSGEAWLAAVRKDAVLVRSFAVQPGEAYYVSTYEKAAPSTHNRDTGFNADSAREACSYIIGKGVFADFELPVTAAAVLAGDTAFDIAVETV
ncbi:MAG: IMP cyclohydrolase [Victivallaceae bacterium]|nr:IMP cyclohydrolase [Victivallaceae bacterium]